MQKFRAQAAVDFLMSYGIALIVVTIAIAVIVKVAYLSPTLSTSTCTPAPGFACQYYAINTSGVLKLSLAQATGSAIIVHGIACSTLPNTTGNRPAYGNVYVTNSLAYYPSGGSPGTGISLYSGSAYTFSLNCYGPSGIATSNLQGSFIGNVWLNYTVPGFGTLTQQVASVDLRYT